MLTSYLRSATISPIKDQITKQTTKIKTKMKNYNIANISVLVSILFLVSGCDIESIQSAKTDRRNTLRIGDDMAASQPTPTDLHSSLERYNLIRRAYWVNGQRERANMLPCPIQKPFGYIVLMSDAGAIFGRFVVDGKVSSLQSYLTPDSEYYEKLEGTSANRWLPDVDGTYGQNDDGIFFFTPDGNYIEWTGKYLYSDIPMEVKEAVIQFKMVDSVDGVDKEGK